MAQNDVTFETKCYEKDWQYLLQTERLELILEESNYNFKDRILYINNVNDLEQVVYYADKLVNQGVLTSYIVVDDYAEEALKFFDIDKESFKGGYYYSIQELVGIYCCKTDYLLHYSSDSFPAEKYDWIDNAIDTMYLNPKIKVANLTWNDCYTEAKDLSYSEDQDFYIGYGFSDQNYLIKTSDFRDKIYNEYNPASDRFPSYGGELFEKRVDSWMFNNEFLRITYKHGSYIHQNF